MSSGPIPSRESDDLDGTRSVQIGGAAPGAQIGAYTLIRLLGEGGMGAVYHARQTHPIRRDAALKIIKPGMDSKLVIARFESERQALAVMSHPNIAAVYDAGTTGAGLPYFAMELVDGSPITLYCDHKRLGVPQRLELFVAVCRAIQHAHQKGIIHRDIKPSNILVAEQEGKPVPKVIDFGLAKALGARMQDATALTHAGTVVGTLAYMSPEQADISSIDVDTRSDVYSLGAVLYELLAGTPPMRQEALAGAGYFEALRNIREVDSPPPSIRLRDSGTAEEIASQRQSDAARLPKLLQSELDWIVMKALEKERTRRYETANALARDLERYLAGEPIEAAPPSTAYRIGKFARKRRGLLTVVAAFLLLLVSAAVTASLLAVRARQAEQEARAVADFLRVDLLSQADVASQSAASGGGRDPDIKVRTLLDRAAATVGQRFGAQPRIEAAIRNTIAEVYLNLGLYAESRKHAERAVELRRKSLGADNSETLRSVATLGRAEYKLGNYRQAEALDSQLVEVQRRRLGIEHPETLESMSALALDFFGQSKHKESAELNRQVAEVRARVLGADDPATLQSLGQLADSLTGQGRYAEAEEIERKVLEGDRRRLGVDHPDTISAMTNVAVILFFQNKYPEATALYREALENGKRVYGADHPELLTIMTNLGAIYMYTGDFNAGHQLDLQIAEGYRRTQGPDHVLTGVAVHNVAATLIMMGRFDEAEPYIQDAIRIRVMRLGPHNPDTLITKDHLGLIRRGQRRYAEAESIHRENLEFGRKAPGPKHPNTLTTVYRLAGVLADEHRLAEAEALAREAVEGFRVALGSGHSKTIAAENHLASLLESEGRFAEAEPLLRSTLADARAKQPDSWSRFNCESLLGSSLAGQRRYQEAEPLLHSGYSGMAAEQARIPALERHNLMRSGEALVAFYRDWKKPDQAAEWQRKLASVR